MSNIHTYSYEGPLPLGSVVAHHCGAAGLVTAKEAHWQLVGREAESGQYILDVYEVAESSISSNQASQRADEGLADSSEAILLKPKERELKATIYGEISSAGRTRMGGELLRLLRTAQGLSPVGEWGTMVGVRPTKLFHKLWDAVEQDYATVESSSHDTVQCGPQSTEKSSLYATAQFTPHATVESSPQITEKSRATTMDGKVAQKASDALHALHEVSESKLSLLRQIGSLQRPYVAPHEAMKQHVSVYAGIPFCQTRCTYCSFPYGLIQDYGRIPDFVEAFQKDAKHVANLVEQYNLSVDSLYMGGGTPTSLCDADFQQVLETLQVLHQGDKEFTVEAGRPDSVTAHKLDTMKRLGVNRISINPQSMHDHILKAIARGHKAEDIKTLYEEVRRNTDFIVNMDFIAGLPHQTLAHMKENLDYVCQVRPENVTIHTLALKRGSPLYDGQGLQFMPEEAIVKEMVQLSRERLEAAGYVPYYVYRQQYMRGQLENIGYTLPGYECEYNIRIMEERQSIISIGPGGSSKWIYGADYRQRKQHIPKDVSVYIDTLDRLLQKRSTLSKIHWEG
ncbi:coproporphyrinogen dehydrogenase HemZ [uncultured Veillonella sp.]|uniref:coproporphyrinogen dehydrogenase HemZ n=2 Tax=uncultured Veillonella sp. TaxID=159268 RepID=UPI0025D2BA9A|nr:coproporphyrinogen dehydrogenase HemZ [uncultured Veillonella sp.]